MKSLCSYPGCEKPVVARSLCALHYQRLRKNEQIEIEVQSRILHTDDSDLANIALAEESPLCVDEAARRILGRIIRAALHRSSATLTDDERTLVEYVRETVEAEVRR